MANNGNLLRGNPKTQFKSGQEASESGRKGGIASGEAKRRKKSMAEKAKLMLEMTLNEKQTASLKKLAGEATDDATLADLMIAGQIKSAIEGNTKAFQAVNELSDKFEAASEKDKIYKLPAEAIGAAFSNINRRIRPNIQYVMKGGRGGLKSSYISLKIIELLKNYSNIHACVIRKVASTLNDSVFAQVKWAINTLGLTDEFEYRNRPPEITYKRTGQKIYFRGCDDPMKLKSIKPEFGYIGIMWIEERDQLAGPAEERSVRQSVLRGGDISFEFESYNPPKSKSNWVNMELLEPNEKRVVHSCTYLEADPEWLGQKFLDDAEHLKAVNPEAYEHEYLGIANGEGGNVFERLEIRTISDEEIAAMDVIFQGIDWGWYPDIFAFVRLYYNHNEDAIYFITEHCNNKTSNDVNGQWIMEQGYDDYIITCDSSENKSVNDLKDLGIPARPAIKGPGSVDYGMKYLQGRKIIIDPERTPTVYKEFTQYEYARDKEGNVISGYPDENNHTIDATRYALEQFYNRRGTSA